MSLIVDGTTGVTFNDSSLQGAAASPYVLKNRIINGAMVIDQRNAGASVTITNTADRTYLLDRWAAYTSVTSKFSVQQDAGAVTPPVGFNDYLGVTSLSSYSSGSADEFFIQQRIEGYNIADLAWGTASAKTVTLSFQVRSSLTGTFSGSIANSAGNRCYVFTYTISAANTWTAISVTIPGDTTGTWLTTNGTGLRLTFNLGSGSSALGTAGSWGSTNFNGATGSVSVVGTNGATWYITGVQLEIGTSATPFERRMFGTELALCQRYFEKSVSQGTTITANNQSASFPVYSTTVANGVTYSQVRFAVTKRASPTVTTYPYGTATNTGRFSNDTGADFGANSGFVSQAFDTFFNISNNSGGTLTTGSQLLLLGNWYASAEL